MKVKGSLYWIYSFTSGCKGKMLVAILLAVIGVLCGMAPYFALAGILSGLIQNTLTAERIFCYVGIAVLGETLKMLFNTVSSLKAHRVAYHILGNIRCKLAEKMMRVPMGVMVDTPSGKLKAMVVDTVDKLEQPLAHMLPEITANVFTPLCIIILLFILDWRMALACMIVIPIGVLLLMGQMKDYKNRSDRYIEASSNMDSSLVEYVNGIEVIKTFSQTGKSFQKFSDAVKNYHDTTLDWWKNTWLYSALGLTVIPATLVGGIPVGAYLLMQGSISFSIYITCLILSLGIAGPLIQATYYADNFAVVDASIRQVGNFLDEQELVRPSKEVLLTDDGFHFEHVSFGYDKKEVLHDITFSPVPGGKTAIVGPSGSGKSTITKLMAGFWDVTSGHIIYGCQDIRNIPTNPDIYVLDEPTANIDKDGIDRLHEILLKLKQMGKTIVISEHRLYFLMDLVDKAAYIEHGVIQKVYTGDEFRALADSERIRLGLRCFTLDNEKDEVPTKCNSGILEIDNLSVSYKNRTIFSNASFAAARGDIIAVTGRNGSGKSAFLRVLCGLMKEKAGRIVFDGKPYPYKKRRELCYMTMQDVVHQLFSDSVWEEFSLLNKTVDEQEITKILRRLDLLDYKDKHPMTLSGGQKQRLALAVATLANKDIMIFDEPTSGLDYGNMIKVCELIKELSSNRIVFVATHDRELMGLLCTRRMEISNESISVYDLATK